MRKIVVMLLPLLALVLGSVAHADNLKIGVVDMQAVIEKAPQTQKFNDDLRKQFAPRQQKLTDMSKGLQEEQSKFSKNSSVMSAGERAKAQSNLASEEQKINKLATEYQNDLTAARNQDMQKLFSQVQVAVNSVAKSQKIDLVLEKQAAPYVDTQLDITADVVKALAS